MKVLIGLTVGFLLRFCGLWIAEAGYRIESWAGVAEDDPEIWKVGGTE